MTKVQLSEPMTPVQVDACAGEAFSELIALAKQSVRIRALLREFLDTDGHIAHFEIDDAATVRAGHVVYRDKPSNGLLHCLAAARALKGDVGFLGVSH